MAQVAQDLVEIPCDGDEAERRAHKQEFAFVPQSVDFHGEHDEGDRAYSDQIDHRSNPKHALLLEGPIPGPILAAFQRRVDRLFRSSDAGETREDGPVGVRWCPATLSCAWWQKIGPGVEFG